MTIFYANLHFHEAGTGRDERDIYRYAFYVGGRGESAYKAVARIRQGDTLYMRSTSKDDRPSVASGFFARATALANPLPSEDARVLVDDEWVPLVEQELHGKYMGHGGWDELVVPVRWDHLLPFEKRLQMGNLPVSYRGTTVILQPDNPEHAERIAMLEEALPLANMPTPTIAREVDGLLRRPRTQPDPAIEEAGMVAVEAYFEDRPGWTTKRVEHENKGWDIGATGPGGVVINVEVKATRGPEPVVSLSRNELDSGPTKPGLWRLAVVTRATLPEQDPVRWYRPEAAKAVAVPTDYAVVLTDSPALGHPLAPEPDGLSRVTTC